jgi:hypothetical protein
MKLVLIFAAIAEAATGSALLVVPSLVVELLLQLAGIAIAVARVAGIALIALAIACWPGCPPLVGIGVTGGATGILLWPAVGLHLILTVLLARDVVRMRRDQRR